MTPVEKYQDLKRKADSIKQRISRAEGALEQEMAHLKQEFGCDTLEEAQEQLTKLTEESEEAKAAFEQAAKDFEEQWDEVIQSC